MSLSVPVKIPVFDLLSLFGLQKLAAGSTVAITSDVKSVVGSAIRNNRQTNETIYG
jgi:hypothetical protein